jgi:hypothetical protein
MSLFFLLMLSSTIVSCIGIAAFKLKRNWLGFSLFPISCLLYVSAIICALCGVNI